MKDPKILAGEEKTTTRASLLQRPAETDRARANPTAHADDFLTWVSSICRGRKTTFTSVTILAVCLEPVSYTHLTLPTRRTV